MPHSEWSTQSLEFSRLHKAFCMEPYGMASWQHHLFDFGSLIAVVIVIVIYIYILYILYIYYIYYIYIYIYYIYIIYILYIYYIYSLYIYTVDVTCIIILVFGGKKKNMPTSSAKWMSRCPRHPWASCVERLVWLVDDQISKSPVAILIHVIKL